MPTLLLQLEVSRKAAQAILDMVRKLSKEKRPAYELLLGIVKSYQDLADTAATLLRIGLGGSTPEQREQAASAWGGLYLWLRGSALEDSGLPKPPDHLVFEVGKSSRPQGGLFSPKPLKLRHGYTKREWRNIASCCDRPSFPWPGISTPSLGLSGDFYASLRRTTPGQRRRRRRPFASLPLRPIGKGHGHRRLRRRGGCRRVLEDAENDPLPELRFTVKDRQDGRISRPR